MRCSQWGCVGVSDRITACPECDSARIRVVETRDEATEHRWSCRECGARFDEPTERERYHPASPSGGSPAVQALMDADPAEVGR